MGSKQQHDNDTERQNKTMAVDKRIQGIRVYVDGRSAEIQKRLFELGAEWISGGKEILVSGHTFLYVDSRGKMTCGGDMIAFMGKGDKGDHPTEVKADELLSWEPQPQPGPEPQLEPFQKVLARDDNDDEWEVSFFSHYRQMTPEGKPQYVCINFTWNQCIPYEGNEHLLGTTDNPNNEAQ